MLSILASNNIFLSLVWYKNTVTDLTLFRFWRNCQLIPWLQGVRSKMVKKLKIISTQHTTIYTIGLAPPLYNAVDQLERTSYYFLLCTGCP